MFFSAFFSACRSYLPLISNPIPANTMATPLQKGIVHLSTKRGAGGGTEVLMDGAAQRRMPICLFDVALPRQPLVPRHQHHAPPAKQNRERRRVAGRGLEEVDRDSSYALCVRTRALQVRDLSPPCLFGSQKKKYTQENIQQNWWAPSRPLSPPLGGLDGMAEKQHREDDREELSGRADRRTH